jgi:two-component system OmpR family response regulator
MAGSAGICADDDALRDGIQRALELARFAVRTTATGAAALALFADDPPDVLVIDIGLPDADGRDVCRALRARGVVTPVLLLCSEDTARDRAAGDDDDYLVKPFAVAELLVRVGGLTRWRGDGPADAHRPALLDRSSEAIVGAGVRIALTPTEFRLLTLLWDSRGTVVSRAQLVDAGWPAGAKVNSNTLDAYLARLRRKLRDAGAADALHTRRGSGYELR